MIGLLPEDLTSNSDLVPAVVKFTRASLRVGAELRAKVSTHVFTPEARWRLAGGGTTGTKTVEPPSPGGATDRSRSVAPPGLGILGSRSRWWNHRDQDG